MQGRYISYSKKKKNSIKVFFMSERSTRIYIVEFCGRKMQCALLFLLHIHNDYLYLIERKHDE